MKKVVSILHKKNRLEIEFDDGFVLPVILDKRTEHQQSAYVTDLILKYARGELV